MEQAWASEAVAFIENVKIDLGATIAVAQTIDCGLGSIPGFIALAITNKQNALNELTSLEADAIDFQDGINDIDASSYTKYDDNINLYGPIVISVSMLLPLLLLVILWPLRQRNTIPSWPSTVAVSSSIFATFLLCLLSTGLLPAIIAYSDGCNDIDNFLTRTVDEPALEFYITCTNNEMFEDFQDYIDTSTLEAELASTILKNNDATCPDDLLALATDLDTLMDVVNTNSTSLLGCSRIQGLYNSAKDTACGKDTYKEVLHLHQAFFGMFSLHLALDIGLTLL